MNISEYRGLIESAKGKKNKFNAKKTIVGSFTFDSKAEATRYSELRILEHKGEITALELQPEFPLLVNGVHVATYKADFRYRDKTDRRRVEDVKSKITMTPQYRLKKKLVEALYPGVIIEEVEVKGGKSFTRPVKTPKLKIPKVRKTKAKGDVAGAIN